MITSERCVECLINAQTNRAKASGCSAEKIEKYVNTVKETIAGRDIEETPPELVAKFDVYYREYIGDAGSYASVKQEYNQYVLDMEEALAEQIFLPGADARTCLEKAFVYARIGNYIDFTAVEHVSRDTFLALFEDAALNEHDRETFEVFYKECAQGKKFLLIADNCGEIVLDKLFIRALKQTFPHLDICVMVRGGEVLNDATMEDAVFVGLDKETRVIPSGAATAGTVIKWLSDEARQAMEEADVILSKGQGNYETMSGKGRRIYYSFLCKCDEFVEHFQVPRLTGMFVVED